MKNEKTISRKKINELVNSLPASVKKHLKRCKKLASFILEKISAEEWYLNLMLNPKHIMDAISYHDFAKSFIAQDFIFETECKKANEKLIYKSHVEEAKKYFEEESSKYNASKHFDKYLYDACVFHHENYDGTGFDTELKGEDIPFVARLCTLVDFFDNNLYVSSIEEPSVPAAIELVKKEKGKKLDPRLCDVLIEKPKVLEDFCEDLSKSEKRLRSDKYGIKIRLNPIQNDRKRKLAGFAVERTIYDPFFGDLSLKVILPIANNSDLICQIDKIVLYKSIKLLKALEETELPYIKLRIPLSDKTVCKKSFINDLKKNIKDYQVNVANIVLSIDEQILIEPTEEVVNQMKALTDLGVTLCIENFGENVSVFTTLQQLGFTEIKMSSKLTEQAANVKNIFEIVKGLTAIAKNLGIKVRADNTHNLVSKSAFEKMDINNLEGEHYGIGLSINDIKKKYS